MRRTTVVVCERSAVAGGECGCASATTKTKVLPLGDWREWEGWRFATTDDVLKATPRVLRRQAQARAQSLAIAWP